MRIANAAVNRAGLFYNKDFGSLFIRFIRQVRFEHQVMRIAVLVADLDFGGHAGARGAGDDNAGASDQVVLLTALVSSRGMTWASRPPPTRTAPTPTTLAGITARMAGKYMPATLWKNICIR